MTAKQASEIMNKLEEITGTISKVAKMEERIENYQKTQEEYRKADEKRFEEFSKRFDKLENGIEAVNKRAAERAMVEELEKRIKPLEADKIRQDFFIGLVKVLLGVFSSAILTGVYFLVRNA